MCTARDGSALERAVISNGFPFLGDRTIQRILFDGFVGCPARSVLAKKNAPASPFDASAYGILNPGLDSDQAAAVHDGGAPW
jgi:hypothetical protein